jgi:hypothetical protein
MRPSKKLKVMMSNNGGNSAEWRKIESKNKGKKEEVQARANPGKMVAVPCK